MLQYEVGAMQFTINRPFWSANIDDINTAVFGTDQLIRIHRRKGGRINWTLSFQKLNHRLCEKICSLEV